MANKHQNQPRIDQYFKHKGINQSKININEKSRISSKIGRSREDSGTQIILSDQQQQFSCPQYVLITALDTIHSQIVFNNLKKLLTNYNQHQAYKLIQKNAQFHGGKNIKNLSKIFDAKFWKKTLPKLIEYIIQYSKLVASSVEILYSNCNRICQLKKLQILILLGQMFLCILPKQQYCKLTTFVELFQIRDQQKDQQNNKVSIRLEKLKCIINYFNIMVQRVDKFQQIVQYQRTKNQQLPMAILQKQIPLRDVQFGLNKIQDYYGQAIMIDFANQNIGGGVLNNGAVQEEIMFIIFPETIISKLICQKLQQNQAIIIYGAEKFSKYQGYSDSFQFKGEQKLTINFNKSVICAIDAINFKKLASSNAQYLKKSVMRQIHKAWTGFQGTSYGTDQKIKICTGKWGCGVFGGDQILKFIIQWIACSLANRQMIYLTDSQVTIQQLKILVNQLISATTLTLIAITQQYQKFRKIQNTQISILQFIKDFYY